MEPAETQSVQPKSFIQRAMGAWSHFWANSHMRALFAGLVLFFALLINLFHLTLSPPPTFASRTMFTIQSGMTLAEVSETLEKKGYIRSAPIFTFVVKALFWGDRGVVAGDYFFEKRTSAIFLAKKIVAGDFDIKPIKILIPEGLTKFETAEIFKNKLPEFDPEAFIKIAEEGYLFPDTYFFAPNATAITVAERMQENFNDRVDMYMKDAEETGRSFEDIIKMASIVETEARQYETRQMIAGILWKRIDEKMPLQVDVSFKYINGKGTFELTGDDLDIDSPYNSYRYAGLPPTPISNPGLESIKATIFSTKTDHLFFLSDMEGNMHYADTFEEHKDNKIKYLR